MGMHLGVFVELNAGELHGKIHMVRCRLTLMYVGPGIESLSCLFKREKESLCRR